MKQIPIHDVTMSFGVPKAPDRLLLATDATKDQYYSELAAHDANGFRIRPLDKEVATQDNYALIEARQMHTTASGQSKILFKTASMTKQEYDELERLSERIFDINQNGGRDPLRPNVTAEIIDRNVASGLATQMAQGKFAHISLQDMTYDKGMLSNRLFFGTQQMTPDELGQNTANKEQARMQRNQSMMRIDPRLEAQSVTTQKDEIGFEL